MATTISVLIPKPINYETTKFPSPRFSNNNFSSKFFACNPQPLKLLMCTSNICASKTHPTIITKPNYESNDDEDIKLKARIWKNNFTSSCDSFDKLLGDFEHMINMHLQTLQKTLTSSFVYGLLVMCMALYGPNTALAASYGRMGGGGGGGSSSYSSPSSSSSSSSSPSSSYRHRSSSHSGDSSKTKQCHCCCSCNCDKLKVKKKIRRRTCDFDKHGGIKKTSSRCRTSSCNEEGNKESCCYTWKYGPTVIAFFIALLLAAVLFVYLSEWVTSKDDQNGEGSTFMIQSVLMLQVGILDKERVLQKKINKVATTADTSTSNGWNYILKEVITALLQHCDSCRFAHVFEQHSATPNSCIKKCYQELLRKELGRYEQDEETFVNVDGIKFEKEVMHNFNNFDNENTVITLLVLAGGTYEISSVRLSNTKLVKEVLQKFCKISRGKLMTIEVLWTPQREDESVSEEELVRKFPHMTSVNPIDQEPN